MSRWSQMTLGGERSASLFKRLMAWADGFLKIPHFISFMKQKEDLENFNQFISSKNKNKVIKNKKEKGHPIPTKMLKCISRVIIIKEYEEKTSQSHNSFSLFASCVYYFTRASTSRYKKTFTSLFFKSSSSRL
jgi:hypothetical protein